MNVKVFMTINGEKKLRKELNELKLIKRPKIISAIKKARAYGDLKENAEYHAAREEQSFCEGRIREISFKLLNAYVIDTKNIHNKEKVFFGAKVTISNIKSKKNYTYQIVGDDESNLKKKKISINSPMAQGLLGKKKDELAKIHTPTGCVKYQVKKIEYI
ncbi:transcription elongation factor GreA [Buchnera aphidicola]|uniref:transcription elongation factor GreA n=1 Tax=Buchnera aphidicola TaxID=9 RepID=UPI002093180B|nr:transcription elongation factor GreA [Buchnera aphidicola]USS94376.1 transcription elongation factor GreA [Buchnera aphidicola (Sipha maydis)]WII23537.1 transcription elongation factor GreA [Buchnera aphidicola (Sipha maydis)]